MSTASLDTENMSFGEIKSSLLNYLRVHANLSDFIAAISNFAC